MQKNIIHKHNQFWKESKSEFNNNKQIEKLLNKIESNKEKTVNSILI